MIYAPIQLAEDTDTNGKKTPPPTCVPVTLPCPPSQVCDTTTKECTAACPVREHYNGANFTEIWGSLKHCKTNVQVALFILLGVTVLVGIFVVVQILKKICKSNDD